MKRKQLYLFRVIDPPEILRSNALRKHFFLSLVSLFLLSNISQAQEQSVIGAAGDCSKNQSIALEWTLGESSVESIKSGKEFYTQGFHQPLIIKTARSVKPSGISLPDYYFSVAPNPVISELTLTVDKKITSRVQLQLTDLFGTVLKYVAPSQQRSFKFNLEKYATGSYYLFIRNDKGALLKCFTIIK